MERQHKYRSAIKLRRREGQMKQKYLTLEEMIKIKMIDPPNRGICWEILAGDRQLFRQARGSRKNHQAWIGGYLDHIIEVMNIAVLLYPVMNRTRELSFSLSDALLVLFLHDLEKPWKYEANDSGDVRLTRSLRDKESQHEFRLRKLREYGIKLTSEQSNALEHVEGRDGDYSGLTRVMGPLAAFCHLCDITSSRIWFDNPLETGDEWVGAKRSNTEE